MPDCYAGMKARVAPELEIVSRGCAARGVS